MQSIKMVDLGLQYQKIKPEVDAGIQEVIDNTAFIKGPAVKNFQANLEKYLGVKHVIPCANGTDALQIALMGLGLQPGDEVITPSFTYVATAEVVALLHLKPVLVDVYPDSFMIDVDQLESVITPKTKAIVPVHLFGQCANMEAIMAIAKKHNLFVVEDTAQAIGAEFTFSDGSKAMAGTIGDIGCTSFFPSKNLGCYGDGGAMYTNDSALAAKLQMIANHGQSIQYQHDEIGVNSRLDTIQAAILDVKLKHLDEYSAARRKAADYYDDEFSKHSKITTPYRIPNSTHVFHQYTLKLDPSIDREALRNRLKEKGIPSMVYYPIPLHHQKAFLPFQKPGVAFPITETLVSCVISLPMHTELTEEQLSYITNNFLEIVDSM
ncbi:MAG: DegT/DnrJ/EryC1/StrS family aminotransferase [Cryomorphaceae bacterium]|nr:DegT/DnrJ/EryC1/StrS family aminotransferase [Cryomorphaceae bacterium]